MKIFWIIAVAAACGGASLPAQSLPTALPSPAGTNSTRPPTRINSDRADFDMNSRKAFYHGHVVVTDPQMTLTCEELTADIPQSGHIEHIIAETNVVINFLDDHGNTNHVTADQAVYDYDVRSGVTNETVTFTGHARASTPQMDLTGEPLIWDRARNAFHAEHETILIKQSLNLMPTNAAPSAVTNQVPKPE